MFVANLLFSKTGLILSAMLAILVLVVVSVSGPAVSHVSLPSVSLPAAQAVTTAYAVEDETIVVQMGIFSPRVNGTFTEHDGPEGPEGKPPQPPKLPNPLKIYILEQAGQKVVELRDELGNAVAKTTWTLNNLSDLYDNWTGPAQAWSSKVEVLEGYEGLGLGQWIWKFSERIFNEPGMVRVIIDSARTSAGQTGWTSAQFPSIMEFVSQNISTFTYLSQDAANKIWIYIYPAAQQ